MSFDFSPSVRFQLRASQYVTGLNQTSEKKVIVIWISSEVQHSISSVSICYRTQSDIRVKSYCRLNLLRALVFNYERLDILRDSIRHPSKKLWSLNWLRDSTFNFERLDMLRDSIRHPRKKLLLFELDQRFNIQFQASRYTTGHNRTSK